VALSRRVFIQENRGDSERIYRWQNHRQVLTAGILLYNPIQLRILTNQNRHTADYIVNLPAVTVRQVFILLWSLGQVFEPIRYGPLLSVKRFKL
jgi:hypothetical protein